MIWNAAQTDAKARNQLVFAMDQGSPNGVGSPMQRDTAFLDEGYCAGLSLHWIERNYAGQNLPYNVLTQTFEEIDWTAAGIQEIYHASTSTIGFGFETPAQVLRMNTRPGLRAEHYIYGAPGPAICGTMRRAWGCYIIKIAGPGGAHAIAARHARDNTFHLFDPNAGHFAVKWVDAFSAFIDAYFPKMDYDKYLGSALQIIGVSPPQGRAAAE